MSFPDDWKQVQITPVREDGDLTMCNNYRPISLLLLPRKTNKIIVHNRQMKFLETNEMLNQKQGGFRKSIPP